MIWFLALNPSALLKEKLWGYLFSSDVNMQFCSFPRLSSIIDWNGFALLTICIALSFNITHPFTESHNPRTTAAIIISMHYPIYLISTVSVMLITDMKKPFHCNHIITKNKIGQLFSPLRKVAYDRSASCLLKSAWEKVKRAICTVLQWDDLFFVCLFLKRNSHN